MVIPGDAARQYDQVCVVFQIGKETFYQNQYATFSKGDRYQTFFQLYDMETDVLDC